MKTTNPFIFIPGGPGLNSYPEENLLAKSFAANNLNGIFWSEPSELRKDKGHFSSTNAFTQWKKSLITDINKLDGKAIVIASSFGALGFLHTLNQVEAKVQKIVLISPVFFLYDVYLKMMKLSYVDFQEMNDPTSDLIKTEIENTTELYHPAMKNGLGLAFQNPKLFLHYWKDHTLLASWAKFLEHPHYQIDFTSQDAVLSELKSQELAFTKSYSDIQVDVCIGSTDPVYLKEKNEQLLTKYFPNLTYHQFNNSSHFPHIEETEKFISIVKS